MTTDALGAVVNPMVSADVAFGGSPAAQQAGGYGNNTQQTVTIGNVNLNSAEAVKEWWAQLNQDTINTGMGFTPNQGAM